jgi:hypothetical protein
MTIPETLAEMRHLMRTKDTLQERLVRAESAATTSGGIGDGMPRAASTAPTVAQYGLYIADLRADIDRIDRKLAMYAEDLQPVIARVTDARDAEVLRRRYVEHQPARKIAQAMRYTRESILRIIRNAEALWMR